MRAMQGTRGGSAAVLAGVLLVLAAPVAGAQVEEDVIDLGGYTVDPGGPLAIGGVCPDPAAGEPAAVAFGGDIGEGDLGEVATAEDGAFEDEFTVPDDILPGTGTLTVRCADGTELVGELNVNDPEDPQETGTEVASPSPTASPSPSPGVQDDVQVPARGPDTGAGGAADDDRPSIPVLIALAAVAAVAGLAAHRLERR